MTRSTLECTYLLFQVCIFSRFALPHVVCCMHMQWSHYADTDCWCSIYSHHHTLYATCTCNGCIMLISVVGVAFNIIPDQQMLLCALYSVTATLRCQAGQHGHVCAQEYNCKQNKALAVVNICRHVCMW